MAQLVNSMPMCDSIEYLLEFQKQSANLESYYKTNQNTLKAKQIEKPAAALGQWATKKQLKYQ
jgi:hypothetical protein